MSLLRIFNGLLQTKSVKKYILSEQLQDEKNIKFTEKKGEKAVNSAKKILYLQVKNYS